MYTSKVLPILGAAVIVCIGCRVSNPSPGPMPASAPVIDPALVQPSGAAREDLERIEPTGEVTLERALALALERHPDLLAFPYEFRAAEARAYQAGLRPNPELAVELEEFAGGDARSGFDAAETTVQIGQPIELGDKRARRTHLAALDKDLVQWDYESARLDVARDVTRAFVAVLAGQERLALARRRLELASEVAATEAQLVEAGKDSPIDELQAGIALSKSRIALRHAENALIAARQNLAALWGGNAPGFDRVVGDLYELSLPPPLEQPADAMAANPDVARWGTEQRRRQAALRLEKARAVPDVTISGGARRFEETDDSALVFGLSLPIPLFNRNQGGIGEAIANIAKARQRSKAVHVETLTALSEATGALESAYDEASILRSDVLPRARQAFVGAQRGHTEGKFDYLHVLETQRTLFETEAEYIDSVEAYHKALADVRRLIGQSPTEAGTAPFVTGESQ